MANWWIYLKSGLVYTVRDAPDAENAKRRFKSRHPDAKIKTIIKAKPKHPRKKKAG